MGNWETNLDPVALLFFEVGGETDVRGGAGVSGLETDPPALRVTRGALSFMEIILLEHEASSVRPCS